MSKRDDEMDELFASELKKASPREYRSLVFNWTVNDELAKRVATPWYINLAVVIGAVSSLVAAVYAVLVYYVK